MCQCEKNVVCQTCREETTESSIIVCGDCSDAACEGCDKFTAHEKELELDGLTLHFEDEELVIYDEEFDEETEKLLAKFD